MLAGELTLMRGIGMRVIKMGELPTETSYEFVCRSCKSTIIAKQHEGELVFDQRDGNFVRFVCPVEGCGCNANTVQASFFK